MYAIYGLSPKVAFVAAVHLVSRECSIRILSWADSNLWPALAPLPLTHEVFCYRRKAQRVWIASLQENILVSELQFLLYRNQLDCPNNININTEQQKAYISWTGRTELILFLYQEILKAACFTHEGHLPNSFSSTSVSPGPGLHNRACDPKHSQHKTHLFRGSLCSQHSALFK